MLAKYILGPLAVIFLALGAMRGWRHPQGRTWLLVGAIFAVVSVWLFQSGR
jgi:DMSO reductase anchor subunit